MRPSKLAVYLDIANVLSERSSCQRAKVGAVITQNDRIVTTGYNGLAFPIRDSVDVCVHCDTEKPCHAIHAEANAIYAAAREGIALEGSTLYCSYSPCLKCAEAIFQSGIKEVYYLEEYRDLEPIKWLRNRAVKCMLASDLG